MLRRFLLSASILACSASLSFADEGADRLQPRFETGLKYGTEHSLGTGEVWVPLDQGQDRVLYGDLRLMGDDQENSEGNLGIGYRQIVDAPLVGKTVAGVHGWIDRRHSEYDNNFYQATLGAELLGRDIDARINAYLPLSDEKTYATPNIGSVSPYLAGSGIYYDTMGTGIEEPQPGIDLELGYRLPVLEDNIEAIRAYGGFYHFEGDETDNVSGWRTRLVADVTPAVSVGGRFQRDDERGSQGFLEATIRFPFHAKKSFKDEGLRARLDESPERDVDIVAGSKITDTGLAKPVLSAATGEQQRVLHVDNTATAGGDGSKENPFNQLKLAEAALKANDVIYVHAGDGTTTGQDLGIVIDKPGVSLIGSGADFIFDNGKFTTGNGANLSGVILVPKTTVPVITNSSTTIDNYTGNGILVTSNNVVISGLHADSATRHGIIAISENAKITDGIVIRNVTTTGNARHGVYILSQTNGIMGSATLSDIKANNNSQGGVYILAIAGEINSIKLSDIKATNNTQSGVTVYTQANGQIGNATLSRVESIDNDQQGVVVHAQSGAIETAKLNTVSASLNDLNGIFVQAQTTGRIGDISIANSKVEDNLQRGIIIQAITDGGIDNSDVQNNSIINNGHDGIQVNDDTTGTFRADLGRGLSGSTGGNSIYGNGTSNPTTYRDMRLDLDGSLTPLPAQGNWWGQAGGPTAGQIVSEGAGLPPAANTGTADTSNALDSDPNL